MILAVADKIVEFKCVPERCTYNSESYKIYGSSVDVKNYPDIKINQYDNVTILGNIHDLGIGIEYWVKAKEEQSKYGYQYKVLNIKREKPKDIYSTRLFLNEILTFNQTDVLLQVYPDIIDRVIHNRLDDIDLNLTKGIKDYTFNVIKKKIVENFSLVELVEEFQGLITLSLLKKLYEKYPSVIKIRQELKSDPYKCLCGLSGIGFKKADGLILEIDKISIDNISKGLKPIIDFGYDLQTSRQREKACIMYNLEENEGCGHTRIDIKELKKQCDKLTPSCKSHFVDIIKEDDHIYYHKETMSVALTKTYETEKYIAARILEGLQHNTQWDYDIEKYIEFDGIKLTDMQKEGLQGICKQNIMIMNGFAGCVDSETEFFNGIEWKKISNYQDGDLVLQYNQDGSAELVNPSQYHKYNADYLYQLNNKSGSVDQMLSDEHSVVYLTSRGHIKQRPLKEIIKLHNESIHGFTGKFITTFNYNGTGLNITDDEIRLMVAIIADGSFKKQGNVCRFHIKKERKKIRLKKLFLNANIRFVEHQSAAEHYTDYYIYDYPFKEKHFTEKWYTCTQDQLKIVIDEVLYWDGTIYDSGRRMFDTCNKESADFIQFAFSACGYRTTIATNDRTGQEYLTAGKMYTRKSIEYRVCITQNKESRICLSTKRLENKPKIKQIKTKDGYKYCFTVPSGMLVLRRNARIFITGNCGKSQTTRMIIQMLKANSKTFKLICPTGRAAKVLSEYSGEVASTIHRGLGYMPPDHWSFNEKEKIFSDVVIVDEFSMTDIFLFRRLLEAVDFKTTKLLLIGDSSQIPSVSAGNCLHDMINSNMIPVVTLDKVFRYGSGGLMTVATQTRNCEKFIRDDETKIQIFGDDKSYIYIPTPQEKIINNLIHLYKKVLDKGYLPQDILILSSYNIGEYGTIEINNRIQKIANKNYGDKVTLKVGETQYYKDDLVIQIVNNYKAEIYDEGFTSDAITFVPNGEIGRVVEIKNDFIVIQFDNHTIKYLRSELNQIKLAYAISTHKSQGGQAKVVILLTPKAHTFMLNSNLIYVGQTRAKEVCYHMGDPITINRAIKKKENFNRQTFLKDLLKNPKNNK